MSAEKWSTQESVARAAVAVCDTIGSVRTLADTLSQLHRAARDR